MKAILAMSCLCGPLLLSGCILAAAGAGAGAGYVAGEDKGVRANSDHTTIIETPPREEEKTPQSPR